MPTKLEQAAKTAKDFVTQHRFAVLSTHSKKESGYPFGSVVPYDINTQGDFTILISNISEHYRNLNAASAAALTIVDFYGTHDPQAHARATVLCDFVPVPDEDIRAVGASYIARFPEARERSQAHGFYYYRSEPKRVRWIGGFGDILWIPGEELAKAAFDDALYEKLKGHSRLNKGIDCRTWSDLKRLWR